MKMQNLDEVPSLPGVPFFSFLNKFNNNSGLEVF